MSIIHVENLAKVYGSGPLSVRVPNGLNLDFERGALCGLVGASGSGKTTLLNILGAPDRPTAGKVILDGADLFSLRETDLYKVRTRKVGFVFQLYYLIPALKAWENVLVPTIPWKVDGKRERASQLLEMVGLGGKEDRLPSELSGGEQQRVAIARALVLDPPIILADEPTGNLDRETGRKIFNLMQRLNQELRKTILIATHDPEVVAGCSTVVRMEDGSG